MILVIGGGVIGAAVARVAARTGAVMVGSLTPRPHVGLWFRFDLTKDTIPAGLPPDARIIVAVGGAEPGAVRALAASTTRPVTVILPATAPRIPGTACVRASPAWDLHERSLQPVLDAMRQGRTGRLPRGLPPRRWIWAEDVARAALDAGRGEDLALCGPVLLDGDAVRTALAARERGTCGVNVFRTLTVAPDPERDDWDDVRWGQRRRL